MLLCMLETSIDYIKFILILHVTHYQALSPQASIQTWLTTLHSLRGR